MSYVSRCRVVALFALSQLALTNLAYADVFKCVDEENHITYSNMNGKGCKRIIMGPASSMPAPAVRTNSSTATASRSSGATDSSFPRVSNTEQRSRDNDRQRILEQELANEQRNLDKAKKELAEQESIRNGDERNYQKVLERIQPFQDRVAQHERNIQAINKELSNLR